jgi:hypothetical protein
LAQHWDRTTFETAAHFGIGKAATEQRSSATGSSSSTSLSETINTQEQGRQATDETIKYASGLKPSFKLPLSETKIGKLAIAWWNTNTGEIAAKKRKSARSVYNVDAQDHTRLNDQTVKMAGVGKDDHTNLPPGPSLLQQLVRSSALVDVPMSMRTAEG